MEASNKKNMALKLELWLSAKQTGATIPAPLRHVVQSNNPHRRASGFLTQESALKSRRKSFSRPIPPTDEESPQVSNRASVASKPKSAVCKNLSGEATLPPKINNFAIFKEDIDDDNTKENQPFRDQNISPNVIHAHSNRLSSVQQSKIITVPSKPLVVSKVSCGSPESNISQPSPPVLKSEERSTHCRGSNSIGRLSSGSLVSNDHDSRGSLFSDAGLPNKSNEISLQEDLHAMLFLNSVLEQKINELEQTISQDRLEQYENGANRGKRHKLELKRLALDRANYEERANQMIAEMGEQMALLQSMAMGRIEVLEKDLMTERHCSEALRQEAVVMTAAVAAAKMEAKKTRRFRSSSIENDFTLDKVARVSSSNSEADYFTDDTAKASDNEDDDEGSESLNTSLEMVAQFSLLESCDSCDDIDLISADVDLGVLIM